jgi:hypothetical protein
MRRAAARGESHGVDTHRLSATLAVGAACVLLAACGGGGDKPAYCSDVSDFKDAVSELTNVQVAQNGLSSLTAAVEKVKTSGKELVASAKSEFSAETTALNGSITALGATASQLTDPQTAKAALVAVPSQIQAVKASFDALSSAVESKCD